MALSQRASYLLCLLCLVACGSAAEAPPDVAPESVALPRVALLGALPPPKGRVTIVIDRDGLLTVNDKPCRWTELTGLVKAASAVPPADLPAAVAGARPESEDLSPGPGRPEPRPRVIIEPDGCRAADVLLRVDESMPWVVAASVMVVLSRPDTKLYRVWWAVQGEVAGGEGALAVFLPGRRLHMGCSPAGAEEWASARLLCGPVEGPDDGGRALQGLRALRVACPKKVALSLVAHPLTPWGEVVRLGEAASRARVDQLTLEVLGGMVTFEDQTIAAWLADAPPPPRLVLRLRTDVELGADAGDLPRGLRDAEYVGFANDDFYVGDEIEVEEPEDELGR